MKTVLDVKELERPEKNDLIIFDGNNWKIENQVNFFAPVIKACNETSELLNKLEEEFKILDKDAKLAIQTMSEEIIQLKKEIAFLKGEE